MGKAGAAVQITIELPPDIEAALRARAAGVGLSLPDYLLDLARREAANGPAAQLTPRPLPAWFTGEELNDENDPGDADAIYEALVEKFRLTPERLAERQARTREWWLQRGDGRNWLRDIVGQWPGDETLEELMEAERLIDDEDAGRIGGEAARDAWEQLRERIAARRNAEQMGSS